MARLLLRRAATAAAAAASLSAASCRGVGPSPPTHSQPSPPQSPQPSQPSRTSGVPAAIGNTPLIELSSLSAATGCRILAKAEHLQPGGSVKDRVAANIVAEAERGGRLVPRGARAAGAARGTLVEGSGGNTAVGLSMLAAARGYDAVFTVPANCSQEKIDAIRAYGAEVRVCPVVPFSDPAHYYHLARRLADDTPGAVWGNQFEGEANWRAHYRGTGPEIAAQAGSVDVLVLAAGTGGSIAGISRYLREVNPSLRVYLVDPPGSSLAGYVETGRMEPAAGATITEGIGIGRLTANFAAARVDAALRVTDAEVVDMAVRGGGAPAW